MAERTDAFHLLFVCTGNICRSPMAAAVFRARVEEAGLDAVIEVDSAGTGGWFEGEEADGRTVDVLLRSGYACGHTARQFREEWFAEVARSRQIPMERLGTSEEVARAIAFLCSPAAGFITGAQLEISGGTSRHI